MKRKFTLLIAALALLTMIVSTGTMWGQTKSEGDTHEFTQTLSQLLNNNATIPSITIAEQEYSVKKVTISYRYNKTITNAVTMEVLVGGTSWGTQYSTGTGQNYVTVDFEGTATTGAVTINFTNNTGDGNGHGTFYVNNIILTEGATGGGSDPEIHFNSQSANIGTNNPVGTTVSTSFMVYQSNLTEDITFDIVGYGSLNPSSVEQGADATEVTWSYTPTAAGEFNTTITATSGTASATYNIYGEAKAIHTVNIATMTNGSVTANPTSGIQGTNIDLTITPADGYALETLSVVDGDNNELTVTNNRFQMPDSDVTVSATFEESSAVTVVDYLDREFTGIADGATSYSSWTGKTGASGAVYAGNSAGSNNSIQLRTNGSASGIVTTASAGKVTKVEVDWNSNTATGRKINVYGKNTAYSSAENLHSADEEIRGTLIGTIDFGSTTELAITDEYAYIGIRSTSGALYLNWVKISWSSEEVPAPSFTITNNNELAYDATQGSFNFTVNNPATDGVTTVSEEVEWISDVAISDNSVTFNTTANTGAQRSGIITLTYTYNTTETVTKEVTITQAAAPVVYSTIPELFAAATTTNTSVEVTFNNWVVSGVSTNGKNVFVTDNNGNGFVIFDNSGNLGATYAAGDILSGTAVSCNLVLYNGFAELTNVNADDLTITDGGTVTEATIEMSTLSGVNTGALLHYDNLTCSIENNKYYLSDGTTTIQVYNALSAFDALTANKIYNITGVYQQYNTTKEILPRSADDIEEATVVVPTIIIVDNTLNVPAEGGDGTITVSYEQFSEIIADVWFCDAEGENEVTYDWITASINANNNVDYLVEPNDGEARTAYFKVYALDDNSEEVYSNLVTVSQAEYIVPTYATLPFAFNEGRADIENTDGLSQEGLGTDYNATNYPTTKLKFDGTGDWLLLQFNEKPGTLTFDIKGNSFGGGTFTVQTSVDGVTYAELKTYDDDNFGNDIYNEEFTNLSEDIRYIKWIYTNKSSGNIGLGNIELQALVPTVIVEATLIEATAEGLEGNLAVTYANYENPDDITPWVWFCDAAGENDAEYDWIDAEIDDKDVANLYYIIGANTGDARTAYFKVYEASEDIFSELVTVTQEAYVAPTGTITVDPALVEATAAETEGNLAMILENIVITEEGDGDFDLIFCDENGDPLTDKPNWFAFDFPFENNAWSVYYFIEENTETIAREAYFKVYGLGDDGETEAYSNLVHVTQAGAVPTYVVSFNLDGGTFVANDDFTDEIVEKEAGTYTLPSATKENINFAGWLVDGTETVYAAGAQYEVNADVSFTAQWSNATTATITFGSAEGSTNITGDNISGNDSDGHTWTITTEGTTSFSPNAGYAQIGSSSKPATSITFTTTLPNDVTITAFEAKFGGFNGTAGNISLTVDNTTVGSGSLNAGTDVIVENNSSAFGKTLTVTVTNIAKGVKAYYISYSYELGTDPIIIASTTSVDLAYNATSGEIGYSIVNPTTATLTAVPSDTWIAIDNIDNTKVTFTATENTEYSPRQGTITLSYEGADNVEVTVIQAAAPMPMDNYALFTGDLVEGDYIIYYNGKAMKNTVTSARLDYADVTSNNNVISTDNAAIIWHIAPYGEYWTIYNADADAYAAGTGVNNKAQMLADGTDDMALWTVSGTETFEFVNKYNSDDNKNANLRNNGTYGFACYSTSTGGALTLYKRTSVVAAYVKDIAGYDDNNGGYYLIASPVSVNPTEVEGMVITDPTSSEYDLFDLYRFDQSNIADNAYTEWYNYKAHNFYLTPGRGYLYAKKTDVTLTFNGMPYTGDGTVNLTYDENANSHWNLIGNPYGTTATVGQAYCRMNDNGDGFVSATESTPIKVMEGVFVEATAPDQSVTFVPANRATNSIAQTNIMVSGTRGTVIDNAIVRYDGGSTLEKLCFRDGNTKVYIPQDKVDYAIVNSEAQGVMPVNFKVAETGNYTISFSNENIEFSYLHLIDNFTGEDIDLLIDDSYTFTASVRDKENRFRLVFNSNYANIDTDSNFAYQNGDDIIVSGEGELQIFDVMGRFVNSININGIESISAEQFNTGVYVFRMVGETVKTQKIVVR